MGGALRRSLSARAILIVCVLLLTAAVFRPPFVGAAEDHTREVAASAVLAYAALRAINATISTAKEAEISVPIFGGFGAKPGMVLDPIDETVARISNVLFAVIAATAVLGLAFGPIAAFGAAVAAAGFLCLWLAAGHAQLRPLAPVAQRMAMFGLLLSLILPTAFAGGGWMGRLATQDRLEGAYAILQQAGRRAIPAGVEGDAEVPPAQLRQVELPWWNFWSNQRQSGAYGEQEARSWFGAIDEYTERAETILNSSIEIIAIYLLRLLVFPLVVFGIVTILVRQTVLMVTDGVARRPV